MASPSHWQSRGAGDPPALGSSLPGSSAAVVIGGGVIGVACAYALATRGLAVTLLEARAVAAGASGRNGGFVVASPRELERLRGVLAAERIECGYSEPGHLALASSEAILERFEEEARAHGAVEVLDPAACEDLLGQRIAPRFRGGRWQPRAGLLDPVRLVAGLARAAVRRGAALVECAATGLAAGRDGTVEIETSRGSIACRHAIVACGASTGGLLPEAASLLRPVDGEMLAAQPGHEQRFTLGMAVDFGSVYWRQDGDGTVVIGGREALAEFLATAFPGWPVLRPRVRWTGVMDQTPDGRPLLGRVPGRTNVWVAAGFGGHGIPPALAAGEAIARAIADERPPGVLDRLGPARLMEVAAA
jgi:gamma-glutamylputrescine oxidase